MLLFWFLSFLIFRLFAFNFSEFSSFSTTLGFASALGCRLCLGFWAAAFDAGAPLGGGFFEGSFCQQSFARWEHFGGCGQFTCKVTFAPTGVAGDISNGCRLWSHCCMQTINVQSSSCAYGKHSQLPKPLPLRSPHNATEQTPGLCNKARNHRATLIPPARIRVPRRAEANKTSCQSQWGGKPAQKIILKNVSNWVTFV